MTKKPAKQKNVYWVISTFKDCFIKVDTRLEKSPLPLTATGEELNLGSLDWMDVITELEDAFNIKIETNGLFGATVEKLLRTCTKLLIQQKRLTSDEEKMVFEKYSKLMSPLKDARQYSAPNIAKLLCVNSK